VPVRHEYDSRERRFHAFESCAGDGAADWPLEQAAGAMVRGGFRHIIVLDGTKVGGILSMRDIVRCWTSDGATCELAG
jgi:hypothetical protein